MDANSFRLHALNVDGILFQERVRTQLANSGLQFHSTEFGVDTGPSRAGGIHRESKLDLWFRTQEQGGVFEILVECKKADQKLKEWIFFSDHFLVPNFRAEIAVRGQNSTWKTARLNVPFNARYAFAGRELKGEWEDQRSQDPKTSWKTSSDRIEKACDQIAIATNSIRLRLSQNKDPFPTHGGTPHFILPIVVTSARIFYCSLKLEDSVKAEIAASEVHFEEVPSVVIRHPLASHLQPDLMVYQDEQSKDYIESVGYSDILVCSTVSAASEIKNLVSSVSASKKIAGAF